MTRLQNIATAMLMAMLPFSLHAQDDFITSLMSRMTLDEKIGQLNLVPAGDIVTGGAVETEVGKGIANGSIGAVLNINGVDRIKALQDIAVKKSRLGIPLLFGLDVIHGYETVFPIPLAMACSWDMEAVERMASISALEATADGLNWTYSPMVDICVDPRWGRMAEGAGEDPFLGSRVAEAMVRGLQGDNRSPLPQDKILGCLKHYALYGASEAGRDYNTVDMSHVRMYNQYFPPYRAAVEAGVGSVMSSFNLVDGQHATANRWLLTDVLRSEWGFKGFLVTDYGSIAEMTNHGFGDLQHNSVLALQAGTDMDMCALGFAGTLKKSLAEGLITMADIDTACRRVLEAKVKLGLFADPYRYINPKRRATDIFTPANRKASRETAPETFVLLKNDNNLLPLDSKKIKRIALIGPLADTRDNIYGTWAFNATPQRYSTIRESMQRYLHDKAPGVEMLYAQGCNIYLDSTTQTHVEWEKHLPRVNDTEANAQAVALAQKADVIVCCMGEVAEMSGEGSSRARLRMPDAEMQLLQKLKATGRPIVLLHFSGRATVMTWEHANLDAIMNVWFPGSEAGDALCDVLFGDKQPEGRLTVTMPQDEGQIPLYYNHLNTGRPVPEGANRYYMYQSNYGDVRNDPLYPFGYGLGYTTFAYSNLRLSGKQLTNSLTATVTVTNTGKRAGHEIVQLYIRDMAARIARPVKELKGFERIYLRPGESRDVTFTITPDLLKYYDTHLNHVIDPGDVQIMVGPNSRDLLPAQTITVM